jgi:hypothetical protein
MRDVGGTAQAVGRGFVPLPGSVLDVVILRQERLSRKAACCFRYHEQMYANLAANISARFRIFISPNVSPGDTHEIQKEGTAA